MGCFVSRPFFHVIVVVHHVVLQHDALLTLSQTEIQLCAPSLCGMPLFESSR